MWDRIGFRPATDAERKRLGIPPAYTDVMITDNPKADLVATAKTGRGKTFYKYSEVFQERQRVKKFARVERLRGKFEKLEARVERDSTSAGPDRAVALTIRLIMQTGLRNGGEKQGEKDSFGASSLRLEHVELDGSTLRLRFPGKKGIPQDHTCTDPVLAAYVRERKDEERLFPHDASATRKYLARIAAVKVHDLRTAYAMILAEELVKKLAADGIKGKVLQKHVATEVAAKLGNTASVAKKSYIDSKVF